MLRDDERMDPQWDFVLNVGRRPSGASLQFWVVFQGLQDLEGVT